MSEFWDKIVEATPLALVYLLDKLIAKLKENKRNKAKANATGLSNNIEIDRQVRHVLIKFLDMNPIRMFVMHFHNGTFTDAGISIQKLIIPPGQEWAQDTSVKMAPYHQSISIPEFLKETLRMVSMTDYHYIQDTDKVEDNKLTLFDKNPEYYSWLRHYGVRAQYCISLISHRTVKKTPVAILFMQFDKPYPLEVAQITKIKEEKKRIEDVFDKLPNKNDTELT